MRYLLAFMALLFAVPAMAQDGSEASSKRSVESAQRFLIELAQSNGATAQYSIGFQKICGYYCRQDGPFTVDVFATWQIDRLEALSRCSTRIYLKPGSAAITTSSEPVSRIKLAEVPFVDVDWSRAGGQDVLHQYQPAGQRILFKSKESAVYDSWLKLSYAVPQETRTRIAAAIDYLIDNCVPPSRTGF